MSSVAPKISIGIVVYNGVEHIGHALKSVVGQTYKNIELIVVDGSSTDGTLGVLEEYSKYISVMISEPDEGIYDAMNKVCSLATGDWLIFLGCDDVLLNTLESSVKQMTNPEVVYYGDVIFRSSGKIYGGKSSKLKLMEYNICHQALFYPKSVYRKYSYSLDYRWHADYLYNLTLLGSGVKFIYTGVVVSLFNDKGGSLGGDADFKRDRLKLFAATLGPAYAWVEAIRRFTMAGLKLLIPSPILKYCRSSFSRKKGR